MLKRFIDDYHFIADPLTGVTFRWGRTFRDNPIFAPVPELADISISNHCTKECSFCYRKSTDNNDFMSVEDYCFVLDSMNHPDYGNVFQVALGGGEPLEHPEFSDIINETVKRQIIPNFTTNGLHLNSRVCQEIKGKVGAVALSVTSVKDILKEQIQLLSYEGIRTNLHYVLSSDNLPEAISILRGEFNDCFVGLNAVIFLTYKPAGRGSRDHVIKNGELLSQFLFEIDNEKHQRPKIGFDACFVPLLLHNTQVKVDLVDSCESGYFSVYVDHHLQVSPCSFSDGRDSFSLREFDFYDIWINQFAKFRSKNVNRCQDEACVNFGQCRGCCPYYPEITKCYVG